MSTTSITYLDISPRQTGKTERLIALACKHLNAGQQVVYVTTDAEGVAKRLPDALVLADTNKLPPGDDFEDAVWFYDEFEWLKSTRVRPNGYYATTPRFLRRLGEQASDNDLLLRLMEANGGKYLRHFWQFDMGETLKEARLILSPEEFRLMYLGEFFND